MAGKKVLTGRVRDIRTSSHKRNFNIKEYEEIDKLLDTYKIENEKYNGYYTMTQMSEFPECKVTEKCLRKRISNIRCRMGNFLTIWEALSQKPFEFIRNEEITEKRELMKQRLMQETIEFNNLMRLIPVGSLHKEAKIIQGKSYGHTIL